MAQETDSQEVGRPRTSIKVRTVMMLLIVLISTFLISIGSAFYFFWPGFQIIEQGIAQQNSLRLHNSIQRELDSLHAFAADWSNWDDTYQFMEDGNQAYVSSNLTASTFQDGSLAGMAFMDAKGDILWARGFDLKAGSYARFPENLIPILRGSLPLGKEGHKSFLLMEQDLVMMSARAVHDSAGGGDQRGLIVFLRPLDIGFLDQMAEQLRLTYSVSSAPIGMPPRDQSPLPTPLHSEMLQDDKRVVTFELSLTNSNRVYRFLVETPRHISQAAARALIWNTLTVLAGLIMVFVVVNLALDRQVARPLILLSQRIVQMGRETRSPPLDDHRPDEIGLIAHEVNRMQDRIISLAVHDYLTGLPNRRLFDDRLHQILQRVDRSEGRAAVLFIDLDGFKPVNDTYGHQFGDELLIATAKRLKRVTRKSDTVARLGGDEFAMIVELSDEQEGGLQVICDKILQLLEEPYHVRGEAVMVSASIGCAIYPEQTRNPAELVRMADEAMYRAKHDGKDCWRQFST